jgi:predicted dehydrogenase
MSAPPLRWGILGTGWIADRFVEALRTSTRQVVAAVGSRTQESAERSARSWGVGRAHGSYEALVEDAEVDVVYVATPHNFHLPHALLAVGAGKHVLVEKPVGLNAIEAQRIHEAAQRAGVFCMEAMWTLFLPKFDVIRQLLEDGALGTVHTVLADMGESFAPDHRIFRADLAGGPLLDLGTYPATLATWVLGTPEEVQASGSAAFNGINGQLGALLKTPDAVAAIHCSILGETPTTATLSGSEAVLEVDRAFYRPGGFTLRSAAGDRLRWEEPEVAHAALYYEAAEVARRISDGETGSPLRPFEDTIATLGVMDRIREAVGFDFAEAEAAREA